jgi:hypothetical protein
MRGSPMSDLPYIDEHARVIAAAPAAVWEALGRTVEAAVSSGAAPAYARAIGCEDREAGGPRPLAAGSTFPGFHVAAAVPGEELTLAGRHHFSRYRLTFRLDDLGGGRTRLRAETRAVFPGLHGRLYRAAVIGTRMHVLVTGRILKATAHRAERRAGPPSDEGAATTASGAATATPGDATAASGAAPAGSGDVPGPRAGSPGRAGESPPS